MSDSRKAILFIGMGDWEVPHLETARELGLQVLAMNRSPDAKTLHHADVPLVMDGKDIEGILEFVITRPEAKGIIGVYTGTELFLTASVVSAALGLPGISPAAAFAGQHKAVMRRMWEQAGIPTPRGDSVKTLLEAEDALKALGLPAIVKPADSLSAQGVRIVAEARELRPAFDAATSASATGTVVVEEFVEGTLHDVNGLLANGRLYPLGISDKWAGPPPYRVVERLACPTALSPEAQEEVYWLLESGARAMGITWGPVKADLIWGPKKPVMMELAPRFHGPTVSLYTIRRALGIQPVKAFLHLLLNDAVPEEAFTPKTLCHVLMQALPSANIGRKLKRSEKPWKLSADIEIALQPGALDRTGNYSSNYDVPGYIVASGTTARQAEATLNTLIETLKE